MPPYTWLPDHHIGVAATLAHADELVAQAADVLFDFQQQPGGIIQLEEIPMVTYSRTVVAGLAPLPSGLPLLVADALVSLRNAVEHTLFAEVEFRDGVLDETQARHVEMPAAKSFEDWKDWVKRRARKGPPALREGSELLHRIEGLQPFQRSKNVDEHPMALLASHTNHSKHRAPAITAVRLAAMYREDEMPRSVGELERRPEAPLQVGEVLAQTPRGVRIPVVLLPTIGINRPGTGRWPLLMKEVDDLARWVRTQAVPRLITGTEPPSPALPAYFDISIGYADEHAALNGGTAVTSISKYQDRVAAVTARRDMAELVSTMEEAPPHEVVAAWWDSLTDHEVIARVRQIRRTETYEPEIVLGNFEVLKAMKNDAWVFSKALEAR